MVPYLSAMANLGTIYSSMRVCPSKRRGPRPGALPGFAPPRYGGLAMARTNREDEHPEDLPWNDVPADSDAILGAEEPDPAEVMGDEGEEVDVSHPRMRPEDQRYRRDSLDERLAEEEPDRALRPSAAASGEIQAAEPGADDIALELGEEDADEPPRGEAEAAEEAAMHVREERRFRP